MTKRLQVKSRPAWPPEVELEIVPAALGDDAPLWGAVALAEAVQDN